MIKDAREFIEALRKSEDLEEINWQVDWNLEAGLISRYVNEHGGKSVLLTNIKDYPAMTMHLSPFSNFRRVAVGLGIDPEASPKSIIDEVEKRTKNRVKPRLVKDGPCKENILKGEDVNLLSFPIPVAHDGDGGRFITWHLTITRDREQKEWVNWGMYRHMVHDERHLGVNLHPGTDIGRHYLKYQAANEPMPIAICVNPDPCSVLSSLFPVGPGVNEVDLAGGLAGEPIELVKCETVELEVPAHAEIIIEGHVLPNVRLDEGPFGEFTGYRASPRAPRPIIKVSAITYRINPITVVACMGAPVDEGQVSGSITYTTRAREVLARLPVIDVFIPPEGCSLLAVVSVRKVYEGIVGQVADALWGDSRLGYLLCYVIVVDETVDPYNWGEILHCMFTRMHPERSLHVRRRATGMALTPYLSLHERKWGIGSHLLIDLTWPIEWDKNIETPLLASVKTIYPPELVERVLSKWKG